MFHLLSLYLTVWKLTTWGFNWQILTALLMKNETINFPAELMKYKSGYWLPIVRAQWGADYPWRKRTTTKRYFKLFPMKWAFSTYPCCCVSLGESLGLCVSVLLPMEVKGIVHNLKVKYMFNCLTELGPECLPVFKPPSPSTEVLELVEKGCNFCFVLAAFYSLLCLQPFWWSFQKKKIHCKQAYQISAVK